MHLLQLVVQNGVVLPQCSQRCIALI
jgi:hypothetical protein